VTTPRKVPGNRSGRSSARVGGWAVRLRRSGEPRHRLLGGDGLGARWGQVTVFESERAARLAAVDLLAAGPSTFDSAQIVDAASRRVLGRIWIEGARQPGDSPSDGPHPDVATEGGDEQRTLSAILDEIAAEALASGDNDVLDLVAEASDLLGLA
jgi:hypothetical protein